MALHAWQLGLSAHRHLPLASSVKAKPKPAWPHQRQNCIPLAAGSEALNHLPPVCAVQQQGVAWHAGECGQDLRGWSCQRCLQHPWAVEFLPCRSAAARRDQNRLLNRVSRQ